MARMPSDFTLPDLQQWIGEAVDALQVHHAADVRHSFAFDIALAAGICLALPEADLLIVSPDRLPGAVAPHQFFVARVGNRGFHRDGFVPLNQIKRAAVMVYRDDLLCLGHHAPDMVARVQVLRGQDAAGFTAGTWPAFLSQEIAARRQAHQQARQLENRVHAAALQRPTPRF